MSGSSAHGVAVLDAARDAGWRSSPRSKLWWEFWPEQVRENARAVT